MSESFMTRHSCDKLYKEEQSIKAAEADRQNRGYCESATSNGTAPRPATAVESAQKLLQADARHRSLAADQILMLHMVMPFFKQSLQQLQTGLYRWFFHQGFWGAGLIESSAENRMKKTEKLALIVTEVSECIEAVRKGDRENEAEELADVLVRVLDYAGGFNIPLAEAFEHKMVANYGRPFKHGKLF